MALKTIVFAVLFAFFTIGGLVDPILGVLGYILHYNVGPERQWWHAPLNPLGIRYSLILAIITAAGMLSRPGQLRYRELFTRHEKLALLILGLIWLLTIVGPETLGRYTVTDHASVKMTKVLIFCFMMTHVITRLKDLDKLTWLFVIGALILGLQAYGTPRRAFQGGRLETVGGGDFASSNALAAYLAAALPIIGTKFMRTAWRGKLLCAVSGVFAVNAIVLCRSRGALLGMFGAGASMIFFTSSRNRPKLLAALLLAGAGMLQLADPQFIERSFSIGAASEERDASAHSRIEIWKGGLRMAKDHPLGVGPGNFNANIGRYVPAEAGMSPHSTYIQCIAELGFLGMFLFLIFVGNAVWMIWKMIPQIKQLPEDQQPDFHWALCGFGAGLVAYLTYGLFGHLMYLEAFWWYLMFPVCLQRAVENAHEDMLYSEPVLEPSG